MTKKEIGLLFATKRKENKISYYYLQSIGLRQEVVKSIEKGDKNYTIESLLSLANALGCEAVFALPCFLNKKGKEQNTPSLLFE